jgi:hypothetical protein
MAGSTNDLNKSFKGATKGSWKGRSDYSSGRPTKGVESIPDMGDKGIPSGIAKIGGDVMKGPVQDPAGGKSKGIPPMNANPSGIGMNIKGITIKDPHE